MTDQASFTLDPRLAQESVALGDLPLSRVLLVNDANYPWLILLPRRPNLVELIDLDDSGQATPMIEIARAARAQGHHRRRQAQRRGARQHRAPAPRPCDRAARERSRRLAAGVGRGTGAPLHGGGTRPLRRRIAQSARARLTRCVRAAGSPRTVREKIERMREATGFNILVALLPFGDAAQPTRRPHRRGGGARDDAAGRAAR
jgi:hypothetical protein